MIAYPMRRLNPAGRQAEASLAQALGGRLFRDASRRVYSVFDAAPKGVGVATPPLEIQLIPQGWEEITDLAKPL